MLINNIFRRENLDIIAGPCVIESEDHALFMSEKLNSICKKLKVNLIYKSSFDKANRTSQESFRGLGIQDGLSILRKVKNNIGVLVLTDIHEPMQADMVSEVVDIIQIPAFLCRQTDLLKAAAGTGKIVNIKK